MDNYFKPTWLYIKQHNKTGLKYFGKTAKKDPIRYLGSGLYWLRHLGLHGKEITTIWCQLFTDQTELKQYAEEFSKKNNIVESADWANLKEENGLDGGSQKGRILSESCRKKLSEAGKGRKHTPEALAKMSASKKGKTRLPFSDEWKANLSKNHCSKKEGYVPPVISDERKKYLSDLNKKPVYCITNDTWYASAIDAADILGLKKGNIIHCVNGHQLTTGGYRFSRKKCEDQSGRPV